MDATVAINNAITDSIVQLRKELKLSQNDVAASLQSMGINYSRGKLSMVETKKRPPTAALLVGLKLIYNCEYLDFFKNIEPELLPLLHIYKR